MSHEIHKSMSDVFLSDIAKLIIKRWFCKQYNSIYGLNIECIEKYILIIRML